MHPVALKALVLGHVLAYRATGGLIGGSWGRMPILLLTTTGRRTGERRTVPVQYLRDGESFVVVATNDGAERHPAWYLNLMADPRGSAEVGRERRDITARVAAGDERAALWRRLAEMYPNYERDQGRTQRELPVVILEPVATRDSDG